MLHGRHVAPEIITAGAVQRLVFVDATVIDHARFLDALEPGTRGWVIDPLQDGLQQIAAVAERHADLAAIAIMGHGTPGVLKLGAGVLCETTLEAHAASLRAIGRAIAPDGCLAVYACEFGRDAGGVLTEQIARVAGVAVATSSDLVGGAQARSWELRVGGACIAPPIRAEMLATYAPTLAGASPPPAGFPIDINNFNAISSGGTFLTSGYASVTGAGQLLLTPNQNGTNGIAVYNQPFSSTEGLTFNFTYVSADNTSPTGADGIVFFLLNGDSLGGAITSTSVTAGALGASIGYSDGVVNGTASGITDGYLGIGFDTYGNYDTTIAGGMSSLDTVRTPNTIGVRGQGNGSNGYNYLGGTTYTTGIDGTHAVQIDLIPTSSSTESLTVYEAPTATGSLVEVYSTTVTQALPNSFYFGFSSGTGSSNDLHQINNVAVTIPVDLQLSQATVFDSTAGMSVGATGTLSPGDSFTYTYTLTDAGTNGDAEITLNDALPANIQNGSWTVVDSSGTHTGTGSSIGVNLLSSAAATIVVGGTVNPQASSGNANHIVSVSPGSAYTLSNLTLDLPVSLNIGGGGSSVSLVSANAPASTGDTASISPFSSALVVDTSSGSTATDQLTISVAPSAGALSASGGVYNATTGTLSATGTPAQLQAVLESLVFTPVAHVAAPGTVTPVTLITTVVDASGNTVQSATQSATISVTAVHDQPSVTGGTAGQVTFDTGTVTPFTAVTIADPDDTSLTVTVSLAGAGSFTAASSLGWTASGLGGTGATYTQTFADGTMSAMAAQASLQALAFGSAPYTQPPGSVATTGLTVTIADAQGGLVTDAATSVSVTASAAPPASLALASGSDSGVLGDDVTNDTDPTVTGGGVPGDVVTLYDGGTPLGTATVSAAGTWSLPTGTLSNGPHTLTATETFGNGALPGQVSAASPPLVVTVDTTIPAVPLALTLAPASDSGVLGDDLTNVTTPIITGTGASGDTVELYDGAILVGTASVPASGTWSIATSLLAPGVHVLSATESDYVGNVSPASTSLAVTIDTMAAMPTLVDTSLSTPAVQPVLAGTAPDGSSVVIYDGATAVGTATTSATGTYGFGFAGALSTGTHTLTAVATDLAGNVSAASMPVVVTISAGGSYSVASTSSASGTTLTTTRLYDAGGSLSEIDTSDGQGRVQERVTGSSAILQIYDSAGTLIGTVTQPTIGFAVQPLLATVPQTASATSAVGTVGSQIALLSESNVITTRGADTVTAGTGTDTVFAAGPTTSVTGGSGSLLLVEGAGSATLVGGSGPVVVYGGSGAGTFTGGSAGGNVMLAGTGNTTLIGGGPGDLLAAGSGQTSIIMQARSLGFGGVGASTIDGASGGVLVAGAGTTVLVAGAGPETLYGGTGSATLFGGSGTDVLSAGPAGQTLMIGGSQATTFLGAAGASTVEGSTGNDTVFAGSGNMLIMEGNGADVVLLGGGATTITGGQGVDVYALVNGLGGGTAVISGFKVGTDSIALTNYNLSAVGSQTAGGSTILSLTDGTKITLLGVTQLASNSVV